MNWLKRQLYRPFFIKLMHWEYWSFNVVYIPIYWIWVAICLRTRSFFFFSAANPSIKNGGFLAESKKEIVPLVPSRYHPATLFFSVPADVAQVVAAFRNAAIDFPAVGKPDIGSKGRGVQVLKNDEDLITYVKQASIDFHVQQFVPFTNEAGIFYYRVPGQERGRLSGIVGKQFLEITGDGKKTVRELIMINKRAILQLDALQQVLNGQMENILPANTRKILVPYGNHARGALFTDQSWRIDDVLTETMDNVCRQIPGFYFGRLDIRFNSWQELKEGKSFAIIEVNGAGSEPTHIYDPRHSLFFAWKEIIRHWFILNRISRANHRLGYKYLTVKQGLQMFREDKQSSAKLSTMG